MNIFGLLFLLFKILLVLLNSFVRLIHIDENRSRHSVLKIDYQIPNTLKKAKYF